MTENSIESVDAKVYKKMTDHKMKTDVTTKQTTYTSSDMELTDNTDEFLALIKANSNGEYDKKGNLVEYIKKGIKVTNTTSAVSWTKKNSSRCKVKKAKIIHGLAKNLYIICTLSWDQMKTSQRSGSRW